MTNEQREARQICRGAHCRMFHRCQVYWGRKCTRLAGLAVAFEATGYSMFSYIEGDRHPQTMLRRVEKEDTEADAALRPLGWRIIDKNSPEDLSKDDVFALVAVGKEVSERIKADLNLLVELEDRFQLGLLDYLIGEKEKSPVCVAAGPRVSQKF